MYSVHVLWLVSCGFVYRYVLANVQYCDAYRRYNEDLPVFLHNRPRDFVHHVCSRWKSALSFPPSHIVPVDDKSFSVASPDSGKYYLVEFGVSDGDMPSCDCEDWKRYHWPCKHFCAVFQNTTYTWEHLSCVYRESPYFTVDTDVVSDIGGNTSGSNGGQETASCDTLPVDTVDNSSAPTVAGPSVDNCAAQCRESLRQLVDLTYLCSDAEPLVELNTTLTAALTALQQRVPNDRGLPLNLAGMKRNKKTVQSAGLARIPVRQRKRAAYKRHRRLLSQNVDINSDDIENAGNSDVRFVLQHSSEHPPDMGEQSASEDSCKSNDKQELHADCITDAASDATAAMPERHSEDVCCSEDKVSEQLSQSSSMRKRRPSSSLRLRSHAKKVRFADTADKPLVTIETYFVKTNPSSPASLPSAATHWKQSVQTELSHLVSFVPNVCKVTKASVIACCKKCIGQPMSCGNVTLCQDDLLSLLPGKQIIDNVSLPLHYSFGCNVAYRLYSVSMQRRTVQLNIRKMSVHKFSKLILHCVTYQCFDDSKYKVMCGL